MTLASRAPHTPPTGTPPTSPTALPPLSEEHRDHVRREAIAGAYLYLGLLTDQDRLNGRDGTATLEALTGPSPRLTVPPTLPQL